MLGAEATWRPTSELAFVGTILASVGESPGGEQALAWQSVGLVVRARSSAHSSVSAGVCYDAIKRAFRMDLILSGR
jgi:hypothetical protein